MARKKKNKAEDPAQAGSEKPAKSGPGFMSQIAIAIALGAASFGTVYMLPSRAPAAGAASDANAHPKDELEGVFPTKDEISFVKLDDLTLTLGDLDRILKIGITLETLDEAAYIDPADPVLRDAFTGYLRALRTEQIQDAAFMVQLRTQLLRRAKLVLGPDVVHGVLITDFLVR